jgi:hypothetical protein
MCFAWDFKDRSIERSSGAVAPNWISVPSQGPLAIGVESIADAIQCTVYGELSNGLIQGHSGDSELNVQSTARHLAWSTQKMLFQVCPRSFDAAKMPIVSGFGLVIPSAKEKDT